MKSKQDRVTGDWFSVSAACPRCGGPSEARTTSPKQLGLPWDEAPGTKTEWRCGRPLDQCTGPTLQETVAHAASLVPLDRPRRVDVGVPAGMLTCTVCGAMWGKTLARCPIDQGSLVPARAGRLAS